ncbi:MAG: SRPBCC domain-containing protein [Deltaproteobacteria bacterium]|jgi:uncharacterized protein YndB with AHSA1/START domain
MNAPLRRSVTVACDVEHAFETFTARIDLWWPPSHKAEGAHLVMEPGVGGRFVAKRGDGGEKLFGEIVRWEPPHRLTYTWYPGALTEPTEVDVQFLADGDATVVEIVHAEAAAAMGDQWPERVALFERGWGLVLPAFADYVRSR